MRRSKPPQDHTSAKNALGDAGRQPGGLDSCVCGNDAGGQPGSPYHNSPQAESLGHSKGTPDSRRPSPVPPIILQPIGYVRSPYKERFGTPRQATVTQQTLGDCEQEGEIVLVERYPVEPAAEQARPLQDALKDLEGFDYIWVLSWMHLNHGWAPQVTPPRGPKVKRGVFATRAPHRPNKIALSALKLVGIDGLVLKVRGLDLLDGTPVLDIKPYVAYADSFPDARAGWIGESGDPKSPDRFEPQAGVSADDDSAT